MHPQPSIVTAQQSINRLHVPANQSSTIQDYKSRSYKGHKRSNWRDQHSNQVWTPEHANRILQYFFNIRRRGGREGIARKSENGGQPSPLPSQLPTDSERLLYQLLRSWLWRGAGKTEILKHISVTCGDLNLSLSVYGRSLTTRLSHNFVAT